MLTSRGAIARSRIRQGCRCTSGRRDADGRLRIADFGLRSSSGWIAPRPARSAAARPWPTVEVTHLLQRRPLGAVTSLWRPRRGSAVLSSDTLDSTFQAGGPHRVTGTLRRVEPVTGHVNAGSRGADRPLHRSTHRSSHVSTRGRYLAEDPAAAARNVARLDAAPALAACISQPRLRTTSPSWRLITRFEAARRRDVDGGRLPLHVPTHPGRARSLRRRRGRRAWSPPMPCSRRWAAIARPARRTWPLLHADSLLVRRPCAS